MHPCSIVEPSTIPPCVFDLFEPNRPLFPPSFVPRVAPCCCIPLFISCSVASFSPYCTSGTHGLHKSLHVRATSNINICKTQVTKYNLCPRLRISIGTAVHLSASSQTAAGEFSAFSKSLLRSILRIDSMLAAHCTHRRAPTPSRPKSPSVADRGLRGRGRGPLPRPRRREGQNASVQ